MSPLNLRVRTQTKAHSNSQAKPSDFCQDPSPTSHPKHLCLRNAYSGLLQKPCEHCQFLADLTLSYEDSLPISDFCTCRAIRPASFQGEARYASNNNWRAYFKLKEDNIEGRARVRTQQHPKAAALHPLWPDCHQPSLTIHEDNALNNFSKFDAFTWNLLVWRTILRAHNTNAWTKLLRIVTYMKYVPGEHIIPPQVWEVLRARHLAHDFASLMIFIAFNEDRMLEAPHMGWIASPRDQLWVASIHEKLHPFNHHLQHLLPDEAEMKWQSWHRRTLAHQERVRYPITAHYMASKGKSTGMNYHPRSFTPKGAARPADRRPVHLAQPKVRRDLRTQESNCVNCSLHGMKDNPIFHGMHCGPISEMMCDDCVPAVGPWGLRQQQFYVDISD